MSKLDRCCIPSTFKPVTHCIFDLDGTILETESIYKEALSSILEEYGKAKEYTDEYNVSLIGRNDQDTFNKILKDFKLPLTYDEIYQKLTEKFNVKGADAEFLPGVERLVKHLYQQKIPIALATSSSEGSVELKCSKKKEFFDMFHHFVCGSSDPEVLFGKPAPDTYIVAARRFPERPRPHQCLVFEDAVVGVQGALAAGMQVIMIPDLAVSYDDWKMATLRLDNLEFMVPELFGLPAFGSPIPEEVHKESDEETPKWQEFESTGEINKELEFSEYIDVVSQTQYEYDDEQEDSWEILPD